MFATFRTKNLKMGMEKELEYSSTLNGLEWNEIHVLFSTQISVHGERTKTGGKITAKALNCYLTKNEKLKVFIFQNLSFCCAFLIKE